MSPYVAAEVRTFSRISSKLGGHRREGGKGNDAVRRSEPALSASAGGPKATDRDALAPSLPPLDVIACMVPCTSDLLIGGPARSWRWRSSTRKRCPPGRPTRGTVYRTLDKWRAKRAMNGSALQGRPKRMRHRLCSHNVGRHMATCPPPSRMRMSLNGASRCLGHELSHAAFAYW